MAIILPQDHPAYARLKSQGIPVKSTTGDAFRQGASGIDEITLGFVNVMPTVYLEETVDLLLARLAYAKQDVRPIFISPEQKPAKGVAWAEAHGKVDALLFTGYAASDKQFHELDFWPEFQEIVNDAVAEELPVFGVCAGAMAVSYQAYGIAKEQAAHKLLGNYDYKTADGRSIYLATSRHNTLNRDNLLQAVKEQGLEILLETQDTPQPEPGILVDPKRNWVLALAHLEYAYTTSTTYPDFEGQPLHILDYQYRRDHNTDSPKYSPKLAARVLPPVNLELTPQQVADREDYAKTLLNDWVNRASELRASRDLQAQTKAAFAAEVLPQDVLLPAPVQARALAR